MSNPNTEVKDALNKANLAIRKYFTEASHIPVGSPESELAQSKEDAQNAILEFVKAKRAAGEMKLTPYEQKCLELMDAANTMAIYKTCRDVLKDIPHECTCEGGCHCGQC